MTEPDDEVTPDGSPVAIYLAVPAEPEFTPVLGIVSPGATVLDMGCGPGRLANLLAARGHRVTGVDESPAMLCHLAPDVRRVEAPIQGLHLDEVFDVVVLASHLVNTADTRLRAAFLEAAAEHVTPAGSVLIQHHRVDAATPDTSQAQMGQVHVASRVLERRGARFEGEVTYRLGRRVWVQRYSAEDLDEAGLEATLATAGLRPERLLSPTWTVAAPAASAGDDEQAGST